jgi:hypothetical protein
MGSTGLAGHAHAGQIVDVVAVGLGQLEAVAPAEGVLLLGGRAVEGTLADLVGLHAGEELGWAGHNKIMRAVE